MAVAALYDIHGNLAALEAVLAEVPEDATILVGGDVVAGGPQPSETLEQVNQLIEARKQMAKMMKMAGSGKMPQIPGAALPGNGLPTQGPPRPSATRKSKSKRKRKARR